MSYSSIWQSQVAKIPQCHVDHVNIEVEIDGTASKTSSSGKDGELQGAMTAGSTSDTPIGIVTH